MGCGVQKISDVARCGNMIAANVFASAGFGDASLRNDPKRATDPHAGKLPKLTGFAIRVIS